MTDELCQELEAAIHLRKPLEEVVAILRRCKARGVTQEETYSFLEALRDQAKNEDADDRILEVADFVAGFCSPHMKVWEG